MLNWRVTDIEELKKVFKLENDYVGKRPTSWRKLKKGEGNKKMREI